ncbi:hypothetical protein EV681_2582 [Advenella incenata]|jgi:hypothetical protein|uniref:Uncharacterized protein n=1 Tax=Advenella incenata TaxID=267800 RepID=A0A4Q7VDV2_9BURK|nr:hypothetical protein EV681_2582 [Advenella incenata]
MLKFDDETLQTGVSNPMVAADLKPYYKWKESVTVKPLINYTIGGSCLFVVFKQVVHISRPVFNQNRHTF